MPEPENLVLQMLRQMRADMATKSDIAELKAELKKDVSGLKSETADLRSEIHSLRADVASDMLSLEKRLGDRIQGLQRSVMEYHSTAVGHGMLYTELEERVRRIEQHLNLPAADTH